MTRLAPLLLLCCLLVVVGCGSAKSVSSHKSFVPPDLSSKKSLVTGAGAANASAGSVKSYVPKGKIVADNNLRPWDDGFNFENYGNDAGPVNMTAAQVEDIFGSQVCYSGSGASCKLTPAAEQWRKVTNQAMAGGHCMGFSVTALRFFSHNLKPSAFGAPTTIALPIQGNDPLQEEIAEDWAYQKLPLVTKAQIVGTPNAILRAIEKHLNDPKELYTLGILNATGGHAVTPFAVEDLGGGKANVLIYDNNFPAVTRVITFDTNTDKWSYHGGPNPSDLNELYQGDATNPNILMLPTSPGTHQQPCPFCNGSAGVAPRGYSVGSVLGKQEQYDEITLTGNPTNHAHLLITDAKGNRTGFVNGSIINEIPGVVINRSLTIQNWSESPEPAYRIPVGLAVQVTINGASLTRPDKEELTLIGPGDYFDISEINLTPAQQDNIYFKPGGAGLNYTTNAQLTKAPLISGGVTTGSGSNLAVYFFSAAAVGVKGASSLSFIFDKADRAFGIDTAGTTGGLLGSGEGLYVLTLSRGTANSFDSWADTSLHLQGGKAGQTAVVSYKTQWDATKPIPIIVTTPGGQQGLQEMKPEK